MFVSYQHWIGWIWSNIYGGYLVQKSDTADASTWFWAPRSRNIDTDSFLELIIELLNWQSAAYQLHITSATADFISYGVQGYVWIISIFNKLLNDNYNIDTYIVQYICIYVCFLWARSIISKKIIWHLELFSGRQWSEIFNFLLQDFNYCLCTITSSPYCERWGWWRGVSLTNKPNMRDLCIFSWGSKLAVTN